MMYKYTFVKIWIFQVKKYFLGCSSLQTVTIIAIAKHAFLKCKSLTNITIPSSVIKIESGTFYKY